MITPCPDCDSAMEAGDSGEPAYIPGWWCDECQKFWSDDELEEEWERQAEEDDRTS